MAFADEHDLLLDGIRRMHDWIRAEVVDNCRAQDFDESVSDAEPGAGDTIFPIDRISETRLLDFVSREIAIQAPIVVVGEGIENGQLVLPEGRTDSDAAWRMIVDPIDGTRGLIYQKRSGWILTGLARNHGDSTHLGHVDLAVQTEIPTLKQHLSDQLWAVRGQGVRGLRWNRLAHESRPIQPRPSQTDTVRNGYATICCFFPGGRDLLAQVNDTLAHRLLGCLDEAEVFDDQYACTGGQLYGLIMGQDRFVADLRPLLKDVLALRGETLGHCCHPYDICTTLIAEEAGVVVHAPEGGPLTPTLDTTTNVAWIGFANRRLQEIIEPVLAEILQEYGLAPK